MGMDTVAVHQFILHFVYEVRIRGIPLEARHVYLAINDPTKEDCMDIKPTSKPDCLLNSPYSFHFVVSLCGP